MGDGSGKRGELIFCILCVLDLIILLKKHVYGDMFLRSVKMDVRMIGVETETRVTLKCKRDNWSCHQVFFDL